MSESTRFLLNESDLPRYWYNVLADSPVSMPPAVFIRPPKNRSRRTSSARFPDGTDHAGSQQ